MLESLGLYAATFFAGLWMGTGTPVKNDITGTQSNINNNHIMVQKGATAHVYPINMPSLNQFFDSTLPKNAAHYANGATSWLQQQSYKQVILCSTIASYCVICIRMLLDKRFIASKNLLAQWNNNIPLKELQQKNSEVLLQELILMITKRFLNNHNPTDICAIFTTFITTLEAEKKCLQRYINYAAWTRRLRLTRIFPYNKKIEKKARLYIERLEFMHHLFSLWTAQYTLENPTIITKSDK